jgi:hypothetical protein
MQKRQTLHRYCAECNPERRTCDYRNFYADGAYHLSSPENLHDQFGDRFEIVDIAHETHRTPFGTKQKFMYHYCCKD